MLEQSYVHVISVSIVTKSVYITPFQNKKVILNMKYQISLLLKYLK